MVCLFDVREKEISWTSYMCFLEGVAETWVTVYLFPGRYRIRAAVSHFISRTLVKLQSGVAWRWGASPTEAVVQTPNANPELLREHDY